MLEFLQTPVVRAVLALAVLSVLVTIAVYVVRKFRDRASGDRTSASELLSNFREMRREGALSDKEFRTIKGELGKRIEGELKGKDETS